MVRLLRRGWRHFARVEALRRHARVPLLLLALLVASAAGRPADAGPGSPASGRSPEPAALEKKIAALLRRADANRGFWGVFVARVSNGAILYTRGADHLFQPASNMKLLTTAAALETLGPEYVFRTTVETDAPPDAEGRVESLVLVGRGDPNLSARILPMGLKEEWSEPPDEVLRALARQVAASGVRAVTRGLVMDERYFIHEPHSRGWGIEDVAFGYGAPVVALAFNDNALRLRIEPGAAVGEPARVTVEHFPELYRLKNRVQTIAARGARRIYLERLPGSDQLDLWGEIPLGSMPIEEWVAVENPAALIAKVFRSALEEQGITVAPGVEVLRTSRLEAATGGEAPPPLRRVVVAEHVSLPLREAVRVVNKASQNLHAEMLLRTVGREMKGFGSLTAGLEVVEELLLKAGAEPRAYVLVDASGVSRQNLLTPRTVAQLLLYMAKSPRFKPFFESLPIAGVDGTLMERLRRTPLEGRLFAKTGTIEHTNALSGFLDLPDGEQIVISIFGNGHGMPASRGAEVVDGMALAIREWLVPARRGKKPRAERTAPAAGGPLLGQGRNVSRDGVDIAPSLL